MADIVINPAVGKIDFFSVKGDNVTNTLKLSGNTLLVTGPLSASSISTGGGGAFVTSVQPTVNYLSKFTGNSTIANSVIYDNGTNVGIGTTSPAYKLHVEGTGTQRINVVTTDGASAGSGIYFQVKNAGSLVSNSTLTIDNTGNLKIFTGTSTESERMRVTSTGCVGIGTTSVRLNSLLDVYGSGVFGTSAYGFYIGTDATGTFLDAGTQLIRMFAGQSERMRIATDGNVGIGTSTPLSKLQINTTIAGSTVVRADGTSGTLFSVVDDLTDSLMSVNNSAGLPVFEVFADDRIVGGQYGVNDFVITNNRVGIGTSNPTAKLQVTSSTSLPSAAFLGGNVGVGTTSPIYPLDIPAASALTRVGSALIGSWPTTTSLGMFGNSALDQTNAANYALLQSNQGITYLNAASGQSLRLRIANTDRLIIDSGGNVGIGTTSFVYGSANRGLVELYGSSESLIALRNSTGNLYIQKTSSDVYINNTNSGVMSFATNNTQRMVILAGGSVSFGSSSDILGQPGNIYLNGNTGTGAGPALAFGQSDSVTGGIGHLARITGGGTSQDIFIQSQGASNSIGLNANPSGAAIYFQTQGAEKVRITAAGNVGIGTTSPIAKLEAYGGSMDPTLTPGDPSIFSVNSLGVQLAVGRMVTTPFSVWFQGKHATVGGGLTYPIVLNPLGGNVGIGTTSPANKLYVNGDGYFASTLFIADNTALNLGNTSQIYHNSSRGTTQFTGTSGSDTICIKDSNGYVGIGTTSPGYKLEVTGTGFFSSNLTANGVTIGASDVRSSSNILTLGGTSERIRIDTNGNVGIGTSTPRVLLDLAKANNVGQVLLLGETGANIRVGFGLNPSNAGMRIFSYNHISDGLIEFGGISSDGSTWTRNHRLGLAGGNSFFNEQGGNVGIGTTAPSATLTVIATNNTGSRIQLGTASNNTFMDANKVNDFMVFTAPFGASPASVSNGGAKWGIKMNGSIDTINTKAKSAAVYAVSEETNAGYNRQVGLALHTSGFDLENSEKVRITAGGNVGIGTTSPATLLHVDTAGADARIRVSAGTNTVQGGMIANTNGLVYAGSITNHGFSLRTNDTDRVRIQTDGNVGIGTTSAVSKLHVNGGMTFGYGSNATFYTGTAFDASNYLILQNNTDSYGRVGLFINAKTFNGANTPSTNDGWSIDPRSGIRFRGWLSGDTDYDTKFVIQHLLANATNAVGDLGIFAKGYNTTLPAFVLAGGGNVGIGTTSPSNKLEVGNFLDAVTNKIIVSARYEYQPEFNFKLGQSGTNYDWIGGVISCGDDGNYNGIINFKTANAGRDTPTTKMVIKASGNVGIGLTTPSALLNIRASAPTGTGTVTTGTNILIDSNTSNYITFRNTADNGTYAGLVFLDNNIGGYIAFGNAGAAVGSDSMIYGAYQDHIFQNGYVNENLYNRTETMRIKANGYVGINTNNPTARLHVVQGNSGGVAAILLSSDESTIQGPSANTQIRMGSNLVLNASGIIPIGTNGSEKMRIQSDGNVGIGTTSPGVKLDIVGSTRLTNNLLSHKVASYTTSYPGINSFGADATDTNITYYNTGKKVLNTNFRGVVWTGKHYIFTDYANNRAYFYDNNFTQITNAYGYFYVSLPIPSGYAAPHGAAWDGRYLWLIVYAGGNLKIVGYDLDSSTQTATIIAESAALPLNATYDVEYADGHLYFIRAGTLYIYKWNGSSIDYVAAYAGAAGTIDAQAITYDGSYLWATQNGLYIYKIGLDGTPIATIIGGYPPDTCGWAWNGSNIVTFDFSARDIYIINTTRLRIDTQNLALMGGNVGIGTTSPSYRLQLGSLTGVQTSTPETINLGGTFSNTPGSNIKLRVYDNVVAVGGMSVSSGQIEVNTWLDGKIAFYRGTTQTAIIDANGNLGIGTTSPSGKLHVIGETITLKNGSDSQTTHLYIANAANTRAYNLQLNSAGTNLALWGYNSSNAWQNLVNFNYNGNVGISTTAPSARLHVNSTTAGATLLRTDGTSGTLFSVVDDLSDSLMSVNNSAGLPVLEVFADDRIVAGQYGKNDLVVINNKVGIGANNPANKLTVSGSTSIGESYINTTAPSNGLIVQGNVGIGISSFTCKLAILGEVQISSNSAYTTHLNYGDSGVNFITMANGGYTDFRGSANNITTMRVYGNGNVGIGTTSPTAKLVVMGDDVNNYAKSTVPTAIIADDDVEFLIGTTDNFAGEEITLRMGSVLNTYYDKGAYVKAIQGANVDRFKLAFGTSDGAAATTKMTIANDGNVGIGSTSPTQKLDVNGSIYTSGKLVQNSTTQSITGTGQTLTLNVAAAAIHIVSMASGATITTISYSNRDSNPAVNTLMLVVKYAGTASITFTSVIWANDVAPTLTGTNGYADVFMLTSYKGGAGTPVWIGTVVAQALVSTNL